MPILRACQYVKKGTKSLEYFTGQAMGSNNFIFVMPSFTRGISRVVDLGGAAQKSSYVISTTPAEADARALASDWAAVGNEISDAVTVAGEPVVEK